MLSSVSDTAPRRSVSLLSNVKVTIDGTSVEVPSNYTILEAARKADVHVPTLCYLKGINEVGACRVCLVEVEGARALCTACVYPVSDGMVIKTNSARVRNTRKATLELILSDHNQNCLECIRNKKDRKSVVLGKSVVVGGRRMI